MYRQDDVCELNLPLTIDYGVSRDWDSDLDEEERQRDPADSPVEDDSSSDDVGGDDAKPMFGPSANARKNFDEEEGGEEDVDFDFGEADDDAEGDGADDDADDFDDDDDDDFDDDDDDDDFDDMDDDD
ncbi:MAG: hypothetical protein HZB38_18720 [Planctomycetes bacterium]|nr:hypothetical protein [Planctomycetota bacterium]